MMEQAVQDTSPLKQNRFEFTFYNDSEKQIFDVPTGRPPRNYAHFKSIASINGT